MRMTSIATVVLVVMACMLPVSPSARAQEPKTFVKKGSYDDVRFELNNAIIGRGLAQSATGNIGEMLERTGADVGSTKEIYKQAEYVTFCSAKLSRQMAEADPANLVYCPFVVVIYETVAKPGEIVVAYRPLAGHGSAASKAAVAETDKMLEAIARDATK